MTTGWRPPPSSSTCGPPGLPPAPRPLAIRGESPRILCRPNHQAHRGPTARRAGHRESRCPPRRASGSPRDPPPWSGREGHERRRDPARAKDELKASIGSEPWCAGVGVEREDGVGFDRPGERPAGRGGGSARARPRAPRRRAREARRDRRLTPGRGSPPSPPAEQSSSGPPNPGPTRADPTDPPLRARRSRFPGGAPSRGARAMLRAGALIAIGPFAEPPRSRQIV